MSTAISRKLMRIADELEKDVKAEQEDEFFDAQDESVTVPDQLEPSWDENEETIACDSKMMAKKLTKIASIVEKKKMPLTAEQKQYIAKTVKQARAIMAADEDAGDDEGDLRMQKALQLLFARRNEFNKVKNRRVKEFMTIAPIEMARMKMIDFINMVASLKF